MTFGELQDSPAAPQPCFSQINHGKCGFERCRISATCRGTDGVDDLEICRILVKVQNYLDEVRQNTNSWNGIQVLHPRAAPGMQWGMALPSPRGACPCIPQ